MNKLILVDGHALIFKMYYAFLRRPMINSKGVDTSILFGFTKYILDLIKRECPTHLAVAFDPPAKTFRHEAYPEYKANRGATPELVKEALEPLVKIMEALKIPVLMECGYEADDIIGSAAKRFAGSDTDVYMVTPDKDYGQLIDSHIFQYKPGKSGSDNEIIDLTKLQELYSIERADQVIDILSLWGDSSDNVPGVRGVGEVSAKKLIAQFGSVDSIYNNIDKLSAKQQEAFEEARNHIEMSKFLVTIKSDIDISISMEQMILNATLNNNVSALFEEYEFNSLKSLLPIDADNPVIDTTDKKSRLNIQEITLKDVLKSNIVSIRALHDSLFLASSDGYCKLAIDDKSVVEIIADSSIIKVGHDIKSTFRTIAQKCQITPAGLIYDIELMHYLLNPERTHKLDFLAKSYLDINIDETPEEPQIEQGDLFSQMIFESSRDNNIVPAKEAIASAKIYPFILNELKAQDMLNLYHKIEMPLISVLTDMECAGVMVDKSQLAKYGHELSMRLMVIENEVRDMAEEPTINISSPKQIGTLLFDKLKLDPKAKKNKGGSYTTDEETLHAIADRHPIVGKILEFRTVKKLLSTYIEPLPTLINPSTGRVHTTYTQALTATGRLSSIKPNLQNIPIRTALGREIRRAFVPSTPDGYIVSADYSQIELRVMSHLSQDPSMIADFNHGDDIHAATASKIYKVNIDQVTSEQRRKAKSANFGIIYGISAFGLSQRLDIPRGEAKELIDTYFQEYPQVKNYIDKMIENGRCKGYVETMFGRKRYLPDINSRNQVVRKVAERNCVNAPIQGTAADLIKLAMIAVHQKMKEANLKSKMVLQVHDELLFDVVADELDIVKKIVNEQMESVAHLLVPLVVDCNAANNWLEAH